MNEAGSGRKRSMIQDIAPKKLDNTYRPRTPREGDIVVLLQGDQVLLGENEGKPVMVTQGQLKLPEKQLYYLFAIDDVAFFLGEPEDTVELKQAHHLQAYHTNVFRDLQPTWQGFGGITAAQLYRWKSSRLHCGRCGSKMKPSEGERAMVCPDCGLVEYPKISPATITAIISGDRLLMARNRRSTYTRWGLIAGFVEIGETFEETVHREAMEEVGIKVKNVTYYKSQPWGFSDTEMVGFFAELDGADHLTLEKEELSEAAWIPFDEIPEAASTTSIGYELMQAVKTGAYKKYLKRNHRD